MNKEDLKNRIKSIIKNVYHNVSKVEAIAVEFDELVKFPELKQAIVKVLTADFDFFLSSVDWVAPRPTTFRINLKNDQEFYLIFDKRNWIAQVEGKKYHLGSNVEEGQAAEAVSRILRYGVENKEDEEDENIDDFGNDIPEPELT